MKSYELVFILHNNKTETISEIEKAITGAGCKINSKDKWGNRQFAYPIKHIASGYYFLWNIEAEPTTINKIRRTFNLNEKLIRYIIFDI